MSQKTEGEMEEHARKFNEARVTLVKNLRYLAEKNRTVHLFYGNDNDGTFYFQKSSPAAIPSAGCDVMLEAFHVDRAIEARDISLMEIHGKSADGTLKACYVQELPTQLEFLAILKKEAQESIAKMKGGVGVQVITKIEHAIQELDEYSEIWH